METKSKRALPLWLLLSLFLAFLAQNYFARKHDLMWDGLVLYALAMFFFGLIISQQEGAARGAERMAGPNLWQRIWQALRGSAIRLIVLLVGLGVIGYVTMAASSRPADRRFFDLLALWLGGIVLMVGAFGDWAGLPQGARALWVQLTLHGPEAVLVALLIAATILSRLINLSHIPPVLSGDEASMGLQAIDVIEGRLNDPFVTGWFANPTLYFFVQAAFLKGLGINVAALRTPSALISGGTALLLYLLARRFYGRWVAVLATLYFACYHYAIHYGRLAYNNIWDPFFALGSFYLLSRGLETKKLGYMLTAAVLLGLSVYFHAGVRLIVLILALYLAYRALRERDFLRENLPHLFIFGLITFFTASPLLRFFQTHPQDMMAPWTRRGIFNLGWVDPAAQPGQTVFSIMLNQFLRSVLAFNLFTDPTFHYRPGIPLLQFIPSIFFIFGLTYAIWHWRQREYFLLILWFLMVIIFGSTLLENPPSSHRMLLSIPPVVICVVVGMVKVSQYVQLVLKQSRNVALIISLALVLFASYQSLHFYFGVYTPQRMFSDQNTEVADTMGKYLRVLGPEYQCYFFGAPRMFYGHATIPFIARGITGTDVMEPITDKVEFVNPQRKAVFTFLPERLGELDVVRRFYPTGRLREFRNKKGQMLFVAYEAD